MGIRELYLEEQKTSSSTTSKKSSTGVRALYEREKEREKMSGEIDKYFEDVQSYFKWTTEDYNSYSYDNAAAGRSKIDYYTNDLRTRGNEIRTWLDANKDTLDAKSYADIIASLDSIGSGLDSIYGEYDKKLNYISGFNSAEEYNKLPYNPQVQKAAQEYLQNSLSQPLKTNTKTESNENRNFPAINFSPEVALGAMEDDLGKLQGMLKEDNDIIYEAERMPRDKKLAMAQGYTEEEYNRIIGSLDYLAKRYGVDTNDLYWHEKLTKDVAEKENQIRYTKLVNDRTALFNDAIKAADFEKYSSIGKNDSQNKIARARSAESNRDAIKKATQGEAKYFSFFSNLTKADDTDYVAAKHMSNLEFAVYNYYYAKDKENGTNYAKQFLLAFADDYAAKEGERRAEIFNDTPLELSESALAGLFNFSVGMGGLVSKDPVPLTATQYAQQYASQDNKGLWKVANDLTVTSANMFPTILASTAVGMINPAAGSYVGTTLLGASAGGNAKNEMLKLGYSVEQANAYGAMVGVSEALLEKFLGGIGKLTGGNGGIFTTIATKFAPALDRALGRVAISGSAKFIAGMADEALEEMIQEVLDPVFKEIATGEEFDDAKLEDVLYAGLLGALTGGLFEGVPAGVNAIGNKISENAAIKEHGQAILDTSGQGGVDALLEFAKAEENKKLSKLAAKVEKNASAKNVGKLSARLENSVSEQNRADIVAALEAKGLSNKDAKRGAQYILSELSDEQIAKVEKSKDVMDAVKALKNDESLDLGKNSAKLMAARLGIKKDLQSDTNSDIINESEEISNEGDESTESVRLRDGSERTDGENTERQISRVESGTGSLAQRRQTVEGKPRDRQASRLVDEGREVSVASLGVSKGSKIHTVRLLDIAPENEIDSMKAARKEAEARGLTIKFFAGGNLVIEENTDANVGKADEDKTYFEANGYINGKVMLVRVDHYKFTADQIARHEIGHDMIAKGEVDINAVREKLVEIVGDKERVDEIASLYAQAYAKTGLNENEIWEECICDSLGDMNIFGYGEEAAELMKQAIPDIQKAVKETKKESNQTRGSPEGKASRNHNIAKRKSKVPSGNDYATQVMIWSRSAKNNIGEQRLFYRNGKWVLLEKTEDGYVEWGVYNSTQSKFISKEIAKHNEELHNRRIDERVYQSALLYDNLGNGNSRNNGNDVEQQTGDGQVSTVHQEKPESDGSTDNKTSKHDTGHNSRELDTDYLSAVERGDMETAQKMVDEAAKKAGYTVKGLHATNAEFTKFDVSKTSEINYHGKGIYFTNSQKDVENNYENYEGPDPWQKIEAEAYELLYDRYSLSYEDTLTSDSEIIDKLNECYDEVIAKFKKTLRRITAYLKFDNPLIIGKSEQVRDYDISKYDGIIDNHVYENIGHVGMDENTVHYVVLNPNHIKSADPVTYDDKGNVIPLSERFNTKESDIRFSRELALEKFGTTSDFEQTGFVLEDGKMLKLSQYGQSGVQHKRIEAIYDDIKGSDAINRFIQEGNVRIKATSPGIEIGTEKAISVSQLNTISRFISKNLRNRGLFYLDITDPSGKEVASLAYYDDSTASDVIYDIKGYYANPDRFRFSDKAERYSRELDLITYMDEEAIREGREMDEGKAPTDRERLANALESITENEIEKKKLAEYKAKIEKMNAETEKLAKLKAEIKELTFGKGEKNPEKLKNLRSEATKTENRINIYDKQLLNLEATTALKNVLQREKQKAYKRAAEKGREALRRNVEGRNKTAMRHKIQDVASRLDKLLNRGTKERNVKTEMSGFVRTALEMTDMLFATDDELIMNGIVSEARENEKQAIARFEALYEEYHSYDDSVTENKERRAELRSEMNEVRKELSELLNAERARINNAKASDIFDKLVKEIKNFSKSQNEYISHAFDKDKMEFIEDLASKVGNTLVKDMTLDQLETVYKALRVVETTVQNSNKLFGHKDDETVDKLGAAAVREIKAHGEKKLITEFGKGIGNLIGWNNLKPIYLAERLGSTTLQRLMGDVLKAESDWATYVAEAEKYVAETKKKHGYDKWDFKKKWEFSTGTGLTYELDLGLMMTLYAYAKRGESATNHLRNDGFAFDKLKVKKGVITYELNDSTAYKVTDAVMLEIGKILTDKQKAFVDDMQAYLSDTLGARGNKVSEQLVGIPLFNETNYLPIRSEGAYLERKRLKDEGSAKIKNRGFTKSTQENARNAIILSDFLTLCTEHIVEMNEYAAFTLPLENFYKVYNWQNKSGENTNKVGVIPALENAYGKGTAVKAVDELLKDLNGGAKGDYREGVANKAIAAFKKAKVMFSFSVVIQQPSSILRAQAMISPLYFAGKKYNKDGHKAQWEELKKYAPVAVIKEMGYFDIGMGQTAAQWISGEKTFRDRIDEITSWGAARADENTWIAIWNAVKRETLHNNPKMNPRSEEFLQLAGARFEDIIRHTQVYDSTLSRSANMRSKSTYMKMLTSFMAEPTTSLNMREMALRSKNKGRIARTTATVYASFLLNAFLVAIPYAMRDDDEDETWWEKYFSALESSLVDNINPINSLPIFKDIWSLSVGYDVERSDMSLASDLMDSFVGITKAAYNKDKEKVVSSVVDMVGDLANLTGIPLKNLVREVEAIVNFAKTIDKDINDRDMSWNSFSDEIVETLKNEIPVWGWLPDKKKTDKIYESIMEGDEKYLDRLESSFKDHDSYVSAVRKALRENDPRIHDAAIADIEGDVDEYDRIVEDILGDGKFTEEDIKSAINSEINFLTDENDTESEPKKKSIYEPRHFYSAASNGNTSLADKIREDIVATHEANGKSREKAEEAFESSFKGYLSDLYKEDSISSTEAAEMLVDYCGRDENEAYWDLRRWDYVKANNTDEGYSMYNEFNEAVRTGKNLKAVIKEYTSHGKDKEDLARQITSYYKPLYIEITNKERANIKGYLLNAYVLLGYDRSKKSKDIDKWLEK